MQRLLLITFTFCFSILCFGQSSEQEKLIELGKAYKEFMFRNEPTRDIYIDLQVNVPNNLKTTTNFILQCITSKNRLLSTPFLTLPNEQTLKQLYIVKMINLNLREENRIDNYRLIDNLMATYIPNYELVDNYYGMLFTAVGNKNHPFDFSKIDFLLKNYNLKDETEKGIFFLRCMDYCGKTIWGYINDYRPANTAKALENIDKFPKFNGRPYYQYTDFYFPDFDIKIQNNEGEMSYKNYYLNKYYETLLYNLLCLNNEGRSEKERNDLLLGSILKDKSLYKYSTNKKVLESIFIDEITNLEKQSF